MATSPVLVDVALGTAAGFVATKAMERFNTLSYTLEPEDDRRQEESARPGPPFRLAAEALSERVLGVELDDATARRAGLGFHYLAGWCGYRYTSPYVGSVDGGRRPPRWHQGPRCR